MIVTFDTNVLVYATAPASVAKAHCARDVIARGMRAGECVLLLQTLAEFANVAIRKAGIPVDDARAAIDAWRAVLPVRAAEEDDLPAALDVLKRYRLAFGDAVLWAAARRVGVRYLLTEDLQDGFDLDGVRFVNPFNPGNDRLIDEILPVSADGGHSS